jgi:threonine dehydratase
VVRADAPVSQNDMTEPVTPEDIRAARARIRDSILRTPLVPLEGTTSSSKIYLKLENLQPTGSFKVRGAGNSLVSARERGTVPGVFTTSNGNMAQALSWHAQRLGVPCTVVVSDAAPEIKLAGIRRYGAHIIPLPWNEVWDIISQGNYAPLSELVYIHPFNSREMIAGSGTIGLEILEDLPDVRKVFAPFGGGGLVTGIATALRAEGSKAEVIACESRSAAPFTASLRAGAAAEVERTPSFIDAIGNRNVLPDMWGRLSGLVRSSRTLELEPVAAAIRHCFATHHVVVEGAGAIAIAAALAEPDSDGPVVAVVSGGNIDPSKLSTILEGKIPTS